MKKAIAMILDDQESILSNFFSNLKHNSQIINKLGHFYRYESTFSIVTNVPAFQQELDTMPDHFSSHQYVVNGAQSYKTF